MTPAAIDASIRELEYCAARAELAAVRTDAQEIAAIIKVREAEAAMHASWEALAQERDTK